MEEKLEMPLRPILDSTKKPITVEEPIKSSVAVDIFPRANKISESTETISKPLKCVASPKANSPQNPKLDVPSNANELDIGRL